MIYIDNQPCLVDMRVRVYDKPSGGENRLYHFTSEAIRVTPKTEAPLPARAIQAFPPMTPQERTTVLPSFPVYHSPVRKTMEIPLRRADCCDSGRSIHTKQAQPWTAEGAAIPLATPMSHQLRLRAQPWTVEAVARRLLLPVSHQLRLPIAYTQTDKKSTESLNTWILRAEGLPGLICRGGMACHPPEGQDRKSWDRPSDNHCID